MHSYQPALLLLNSVSARLEGVELSTFLFVHGVPYCAIGGPPTLAPPLMPQTMRREPHAKEHNQCFVHIRLARVMGQITTALQSPAWWE